jgi:hypothetical protein
VFTNKEIGGIGPTDQLQIVQSSPLDGATMINSTYWVNLPVGYNLLDHLNVSVPARLLSSNITDQEQTDAQISHPSISYYDWVAAWDTPIAADASSYLSMSSEILSLFSQLIKTSQANGTSCSSSTGYRSYVLGGDHTSRWNNKTISMDRQS